MKQKRGQFFLLAAIILVSLLAGIFLYTNQVFLQDYRSGVRLLKEEVNQETYVVVSHYVAKGEDNIVEFIIKMSESLIDRRDSVEMIFIYNLDGNISIFNLAEEEINLTVDSTIVSIKSQRETIVFSVSVGGSGTDGISFSQIEGNITHIPISSFGTNPQNLTFIWNEDEYNPRWPEDKNFYFVLKEDGYASQT
jgi:hypothetical protein